jgi:hypothetical protein
LLLHTLPNVVVVTSCVPITAQECACNFPCYSIFTMLYACLPMSQSGARLSGHISMPIALSSSSSHAPTRQLYCCCCPWMGALTGHKSWRTLYTISTIYLDNTCYRGCKAHHNSATANASEPSLYCLFPPFTFLHPHMAGSHCRQSQQHKQYIRKVPRSTFIPNSIIFSNHPTMAVSSGHTKNTAAPKLHPQGSPNNPQ